MDGIIKRDEDLELTDQQLKDVNRFITEITENHNFSGDFLTATRFMRAKKFNILSATDLYVRHQYIRNKENLIDVNPLEGNVLNELISEKFTFLLNPDPKTGASVCIFTAKLHFPSDTTHQNTLKALIFQLDSALSSVSAQKNGLIFIYNMNGSLYSNFDFQLSVKILNLLKGGYPARLCKVVIYTPPLWFRASFNFLRLFVREKLQDRICIVTRLNELYQQVDESILPNSLGGTAIAEHSHQQWLTKAFTTMGYSPQMFRKELSQAINKCSDNNGGRKMRCGHLQQQSVAKLDAKQKCNETEDEEKSEIELKLRCMRQNMSSSIATENNEGLVVINSNDNEECITDYDDDDDGGDGDGDGDGDGVYEGNNADVADSDLLIDRDISDDGEYEMLSEDSWELNLDPSGDEDVIQDQVTDSYRNGEDEDNKTVENTPNKICSSARITPRNKFEFSYSPEKIRRAQELNQNRPLKRRNAVRHDVSSDSSSYLNRYRDKKEIPSWILYRPNEEDNVNSLHLAPKDDEDNDEEDSGVTIEFFFHNERHSFYSTLTEFQSDRTFGEPPQFTSYSLPINQSKNRYSDIHCTEKSRVKLIRKKNHPSTPSATPHPLKPTDYIHANWVDGYRQKNAYICTQGPLATTISDFWHMIIQYRVQIIVMTTRPREQNRDKCFQYWPEEDGGTQQITGINEWFDTFEVKNLRSKEFGPNCPNHGVCQTPEQHWYRVTLLHVKNLRTGQEHRVNHFYFHSWPDQGIPHSSEGFLHFILQIRQTYRLNIAKLGYESEMDQSIPPPPILVHCSAGIGRTGTYIVTEICCKSLSDCGRFNLLQTMLKVRSQRHKCVQNAYQYLFCRNTIIDYAKQLRLLQLPPTPPPEEEEEEEEEEIEIEIEGEVIEEEEEEEEEEVEDIGEVSDYEEVYDNEEEPNDNIHIDNCNNTNVANSNQLSIVIESDQAQNQNRNDNQTVPSD